MKRTRRTKPMSLIVLGNNKTPVGSKISVIGWLKGNLNMTHMGNSRDPAARCWPHGRPRVRSGNHMGNFYFREGKRNPMTILPPTHHFFQDVVKSWYKLAENPVQMD